MSNAEELRTILTRIIKNNKLYGCSFTYGVALRMGIVNQLFPDELDQLITDTIEDIYKGHSGRDGRRGYACRYCCYSPRH